MTAAPSSSGPDAPTPFAWISCVGEKGGAETLMIECLRALDRKRFRPHVIQLRPGPLEGLLRDLDVEVHVLATHRMREVHRVAGAIGRIRQLVREHGLRLLHSNGFRAHVYGGLAAWSTGIPEVWTTHTHEQPGWSTRAILAIPTAHVLANCPRTAGYFRAQGLPTAMIWPGVDPGRLGQLAAASPRADLAARHGIPPGRRWIAVGARLQRFKGQAHFIRALAEVPRTADAHGLVIGGSLFGQETDYQQELRALAEDLGVADRVTFTGFVSDADLAGFLAASDLVAHPALEEDFGLTVAEAQALGTPVVAFSAVGPAEIIVHGETGWLVPVGDVGALAKAISEALASPETMARCGAAGRARARSLFGSDVHARKTEAIYETCMVRSPRTGPPRSGRTSGPTPVDVA